MDSVNQQVQLRFCIKNIVKHILFKVNAASADWFLNMDK